ncbi:unnamed protein product [Knipowitschia caucasica]
MANVNALSEVGEESDETLKINEPQDESNSVADDNSTRSQDAQRSQRVRRLTEKGQELHNDQVKKATHRFSMCYEKWKAVTKDAKGAMDGSGSKNLLTEHVSQVTSALNNVCSAYDGLRRMVSPDGDIRRRMDTREAVTRRICEASEKHHYPTKEGSLCLEHPKDTESVFKFAAASKTNSKVSSCHSSRHSSKRQDAAAEVAANEAALEVLLEQENRIKEIEKQEAELAQRQRDLEAKRREVERLETVKN